jgi:Phage Mu protein F like protein
MPAKPAIGFGTPFEAQLEFFKNKINLPSKRWDDIQKSAHDRAFIVAGAAKADLLNDFNGAIRQRMMDGKGLKAFVKDFEEIVKRNGWTGWTGESTKAGRAWRAKIIYQTNMATSYAAGRWKQLTDPDLLKLRPYWRYHHADNVTTPRPLHVSWDGLTLPHDHPFWDTHFPPNGWGCHCFVSAVDEAEYVKSKADGKGGPPAGWDAIDPKTGAQAGIDKGFDYAPGASVNRQMVDFIGQKLINLDAPIGAAMWESLKPALAMERQMAWWETLDAWMADKYARGRVEVVGNLSPRTLQWLADNQKPAPVSAEIAIRDNLPIGVKQARHDAAQNGLSVEEWRALPAMLDRPGAIYYDTRNGRLIFVSDELGPAKIAVEFDPDKLKGGVNMIVSAFRVDDLTISGDVKGGIWTPIEVSGH